MITGFGDMNSWGNMYAPQTNFPATVGFTNDFMNMGQPALGYTDWMRGTGNAVAQAAGGGGIMDSLRSSGFLGTEGNQGWGGLALGALGSLGGAFMGMKNYSLAKEALQNSQNQFLKNYEAQRNTLNTQLEDRQRARVNANSNNESVDSYMSRNRIQ